MINKLSAKEVIPASYLDDETKFFINPTGRFVIGNFKWLMDDRS